MAERRMVPACSVLARQANTGYSVTRT